MRFKQKLLGLLLLILFLGTAVASWQLPISADSVGSEAYLTYLPLVSYPGNYRVEPYPDEQNVDEYRLFCEDHHFFSVIILNDTFNLRPHPGEDINGWGSSLYLQPFFPDAVLQHTTMPIITATNYGIEIEAEGSVSLNGDETYGNWMVSLLLRCHPGSKLVSGDGTYQISLDGLMAPHGDLNLYRIASNYLIDVPLLSGGSGNTGDMETVLYAYDGGAVQSWTPTASNGGHFPTDEADQLMIEVVGACNEVDTAAQGYAAIAAAAKPSLKVVLTSQNVNTDTRFGAFYATEKRQDFWEDNVGITPLIIADSTDTSFAFDVTIESTAIASDGQIPCWNP